MMDERRKRTKKKYSPGQKKRIRRLSEGPSKASIW